MNLIFPLCYYIHSINQYIYGTHDQHFPSESEERAAFWVGFGEHYGDAMEHKLLDKITHEIIYRSAINSITKANPNHRLEVDGGRPAHQRIQVLKFQLFLSDVDRMILIHLTSSICLTLILMI